MQRTLALIISDYLAQSSESTTKVPDYIRSLFRHYCLNTVKPRFDGIDQIQHKMVLELQEHIFINIIPPNGVTTDENAKENMPEAQDSDTKQNVSDEKVLKLFPNATKCLNGKTEIFIDHSPQSEIYIESKVPSAR